MSVIRLDFWDFFCFKKFLQFDYVLFWKLTPNPFINSPRTINNKPWPENLSVFFFFFFFFLAMAESAIVIYYCRVHRTQSCHCQHQHDQSLPDLKPADFFLFQVTAKLGRPSIGSNATRRTLLRTDIFTPCKHFFRNSRDFKERLIAPPYLTYECLDQLTPRIILQVGVEPKGGLRESWALTFELYIYIYI